MKYTIVLISGFLLGLGVNAQIRMSDFGAYPDDGKDDLKAIQQAVKALKLGNSKIMIFEKRTYDLFFENVNTTKGINNQDNVSIERNKFQNVKEKIVIGNTTNVNGDFKL